MMSRIYDNWEKLVGAVVRREKDRQLAYCESFSTTSSTDLSSRSSFDIPFVGDVHVSAGMSRNYDSWENDRQLAYCESFSISYSVDVSSRFSFDSAVEDADFRFNPFVGDVHLPPVSRSPAYMFDPSYPSSRNILPFWNVMAIEYEEIKKATKNFQQNLLLGEGGFGPVFKGWLHHHYLTAMDPGSGIAVAVKKLNKEGFQGHNEWVDEIYYLSQIHHPNMVKLIGYSFETDDRIVVYEFMPKGSLDNHLFTSRHHSIPWATRMKVAVGAARALAFLHGLELPVIHRNIKCGDILLDSDFNPKLSDFGLATDGPTSYAGIAIDGRTGDTTHVHTQVMGTLGYAAPEYVATGRLTTRCDVYGFGVVLVELITGLRAFDNKRPTGQEKLMDWVKPQLRNKKKLLKIIDSRLDGQYPRKDAYKLARIGLQCVSLDPKLRPRMNDVVAALEKL